MIRFAFPCAMSSATSRSLCVRPPNASFATRPADGAGAEGMKRSSPSVKRARSIERAPRLETLTLRAMHVSERRLDPPQGRARPLPRCLGTRLLERPLGLLVPLERREGFAPEQGETWD